VRIRSTMWNRARVTDPDAAPPPTRSLYRVRRAYFARALGRSAVVAAVLVLLTTVCLAVSAPTAVTALLVVVTAVALVVVAVVAVSVMIPPTLLQLDGQGFRASKRFTAGPRQAGWLDVQSAASQEGPEGWVLIIAHHDGEHTAVPLRLADARPVTVEQDVRARLNEAHGYQGLA
jgi:hypothetical protein